MVDWRRKARKNQIGDPAAMAASCSAPRQSPGSPENPREAMATRDAAGHHVVANTTPPIPEQVQTVRGQRVDVGLAGGSCASTEDRENAFVIRTDVNVVTSMRSSRRRPSGSGDTVAQAAKLRAPNARPSASYSRSSCVSSGARGLRSNGSTGPCHSATPSRRSRMPIDQRGLSSDAYLTADAAVPRRCPGASGAVLPPCRA